MKTLRKFGRWLKDVLIVTCEFIANFILHVGEFIWDIVLIVVMMASD